MAIWSRIRSRQGQANSSLKQVASAAVLSVPDDVNTFEVTGTTAITSLSSEFIEPGREIVLLGTSTVTITDTASPANEGDLNLGANVSFTDADVLKLVQLNSGVWLKSGLEQS